MTISILQDELCKELEKIFEHTTFKAPSGEKKIKAYKQCVPLNRGNDAEDEDEPQPYIIVKLVDGNTEVAKGECNILLIISIYDNDNAMQGHEVLLNIINDIQQRFIETPLLGECFIAKPKMTWTLQEEDTDETWPYFYGGMYMSFEMPGISRGGNDFT